MCCGMRDKDKPTERPLNVWKRNRNFSNSIRVPNSCCMRAEWLGGCRKNPTERDTYMEVRFRCLNHPAALEQMSNTSDLWNDFIAGLSCKSSGFYQIPRFGFGSGWDNRGLLSAAWDGAFLCPHTDNTVIHPPTSRRFRARREPVKYWMERRGPPKDQNPELSQR